jgi:sigma-B regulation protein RsbU (phosphoserine phosphatase)
LRAGIISASGVLGTLLINLLLLRLVDAPVRNLTTYVREVGRGTFGRSFQAGSSAEISYLAGEVNAMSRELARRENDRQRQLARARQLQRHLMSAGSPRSHDRSAMAFFPADEVAGDFAEVISLADGSVLLCLADVSGHGIAAAMGAAMIKTLLLSHGSSQSTPADILTQINTRFLDASLPGDFASMIIVHIQSDRREASYASAGHETCYLRRNHGDVVALESTGTLLGVEPRADYEDARLELEPGDIFVLLSDGVSESMDDAGTLYGRAQLIQTLRESSGMTPSELAAHICHSVESFRGAGRATDDMTILAYAMESQN